MITVFERAMAPQSPTKPRVTLNILMGLVLGLAGGLGLGLIFENLDTALYKAEEIEAVTQLAALAKIPAANKEKRFVFQDIFSPLAEAFRGLATNVQQINLGRTLKRKVLLVLSAEPNQGKSLIVSQLALCLAESGRTVVVVDCDLRRPTLHRLFMLPNKCGLTDVLEQKVPLEKALQKSLYRDYQSVWVLSSGRLPEYPTKLLGSAEMADLIHRLALEFDYVLLDTPAMLGTADVTALIQKVDGYLWVVRQGHASREAVETARKFLEGFSEKSIGLVVNQTGHDGYYGYYRHRGRLGVPVSSKEEDVLTIKNVLN
jgi:capsular exopolysaccharide synthesis family protein